MRDAEATPEPQASEPAAPAPLIDRLVHGLSRLDRVVVERRRKQVLRVWIANTVGQITMVIVESAFGPDNWLTLAAYAVMVPLIVVQAVVDARLSTAIRHPLWRTALITVSHPFPLISIAIPLGLLIESRVRLDRDARRLRD